MRCPRCGNENPATHRFCGMCGTSLLQAAVPAPAGPAAKPPAPAPAAVPTAASAGPSAGPPAVSPAAPAQRVQAAPSAEPVISGPSFLGLNQPAPAARRTNPLSIDPHAGPSSSNLDYLLQDDEEPKRGGAWKFVLIVIALALAGGFGYLHWKNQSVPQLGAGANKPAAAAQSSDASDSSSPAPSSSAASPAAAPSQPASAPGGTGAAGASPAAAAPASAAPASSVSPAANPAATSAQPNSAPDSGASGAGGAGSATPQPAAAGGAAANTPNSAPPAGAPESAPAQLPAKPRATIPARVTDPVAEAQKYIYGKGMPQDCDRGLRILKPAVNQGNPKAMIEMGALYSAGLCTPRDLPTAYRWFALALRKDPNNESLQADLNKLWGEMTQPERQLAIKLSQ
ncbi:exported hypothetical protein [Candidatus Sulfotelmatobacter kueseliae]|uniref:Zinc-ribbon domain-containing protein n=1 Tax=Candidatus Sulfotelmatobacter kueseliae TaxID=2042962 RepID=A0A2U3L2D3_9BACT|nr:exported hypothetical protein [Candidatus Sulfotelmatobacter kueseliae]